MASLAAAATRQAAGSSSAQSGGMIKWAVGGWLFFIAENAVLSENRQYLITSVFGNDDDMYHAVYGACSTAAMASILYSYRKLKLQQTVTMMALSPLRLGGAFVPIGLGLILASQAAPKLQVPVELRRPSSSLDAANTTESNALAVPPPAAQSFTLKVRCPFDFTDHSHPAQDEATTPVSVHGLDRVSRHPGLWAFGLTVAGNALLQPTLALQLWMLGPLAVAALGGAHQDSRFRRGLGGTLDPQYAALTSNVPFVAMLTGRQGPNALSTWVTQELKPINAAIATTAAAIWILSRGRATAVAPISLALGKKV